MTKVNVNPIQTDYQSTTAWLEAQKALEEQNKINKDMFIKIKEWWC